MITSPIKDISTIEMIKELYRKKGMVRDLLLFEFKINTGMNLKTLLKLHVKDVKDKYYLTDETKTFQLKSVASWRKIFDYDHYLKYKDLSYLQWLFHQTTVALTLKFIDLQENMNLRYIEGVVL